MKLYIKILSLHKLVSNKLDHFDKMYWIELSYNGVIHKSKNVDYNNNINHIFIIDIKKPISYFFISLLGEDNLLKLEQHVLFKEKIHIYHKSIKKFQTNYIIFEMGDLMYDQKLKILKKEHENLLLQESMQSSSLNNQNSLSSSLHELQQKHNVLYNSFDEMKQKNTILQQSISSLKQENIHMSQSFDEIKHKNNILQQSITSLKQENTTISQSFDALKQKNITLQKSITSLQKEKDKLQQSIEFIKQQKEDANHNYDALEKDYNNLDLETETLIKKNDTLHKSNEKLKSDMNLLKKNNANLKKSKASLIKQIKSLENNYNKLLQKQQSFEKIKITPQKYNTNKPSGLSNSIEKKLKMQNVNKILEKKNNPLSPKDKPPPTPHKNTAQLSLPSPKHNLKQNNSFSYLDNSINLNLDTLYMLNH